MNTTTISQKSIEDLLDEINALHQYQLETARQESYEQGYHDGYDQKDINVSLTQ